MTPPMGTPVTIRGRHFDTVAQAAAAHGVKISAVYNAKRAGRLDSVGTGPVVFAPLPVMICGVQYESAADAAKALKMPRGRIYDAVADGDPDRVLRKPRRKSWRRTAITLGGVTYPSLSAASIALGFTSAGYIAQVRRTNSRLGWQRILAAAMSLDAKQIGQR